MSRAIEPGAERAGSSGTPAEASLLLPVLRGLLRLGWVHQMSRAAVELPWYEKRIDLAIAGRDRLITVELKVDRWRRAIEQAYLNRWVAEEAWVALWHAHVTPQAVQAAADAEVGLMIVTWRTVYPVQYPGLPPRAPDAALDDALRASAASLRDLLSFASAYASSTLA